MKIFSQVLAALLLFAPVIFSGAGAQSTDVLDSQQFLRDHTRPADLVRRDHDAEIERLLTEMTLQEKIGQMTQFEIGMVTTGEDQDIQIDREKLDKAILEYGVGSILNVRNEALPVARWHQFIGQIQQTAARSRLRIPVIYGIDTIHGANYILEGTLFPQPLGMAATWNPDLMLRGSQVAADETRAAGIPWNFSPVLDLGRHPVWPRLYETFGEDPYLASVMAVATIRGYEGLDPASDRSVASTMKHYVGYSYPASGADRTPALIPERTMRELFLPSFAAGARADALTVMVNSGEVNGIPTHEDRYLLEDVLRGELGFRGLVVSDWEDIKKMVTAHRTHATEKSATRAAVMAGVDMSMVPSDYSFPDLLLELVREGQVPMSRIDEAVRRILWVKFQLGLFKNPLPNPAAAGRVGTPQARQAALQAAQESMTLLKNEKAILPLPRKARVLVTGPTADSLVPLNNGWTYTWQGRKAELYPKDRLTIRAAIAGKVGAANMTFVPGVDFEKEINIRAAVDAARKADVVVVCIGENSYTETPGNIVDLTLPESQLRLVEQIAATGKPVVLVLVQGRPRVISRVADRAAAILMAYNPGNEGGQAVADVLFGDHNPSGRLPITYPRHPNALLAYDHKPFETAEGPLPLAQYAPQFPFGHGLSYTTFAYSDLKLSSKELPRGGELQVAVTVTNTGKRAGKDAVILYLSQLAASITPPGKRVRRFAKVSLQPGESRTLNFTLGREDLSFIGRGNRPIVEPGEFVLTVGDQQDRFVLR